METIPQQLENGVIYISLRYNTTMHLCPCGCKREVVAPLAPHRWHMTYDGRTVSLDPSIGNVSFPCKSHYWIKQDKVVWSYALSDGEIREALDDKDRRIDRATDSAAED